MRNNSEKFYEKSGRLIDLFYKPISSLDDNYENQKRKLLKELGSSSPEDFLTDVLSWQFLIDYAFLGLNREKVEEGVNVNWENYVPKNYVSQYHYQDKRPSKVPYFKEWVKVIDCKDKYLSESSDFWVKRIRNSFMHGNFEFDYDNIAKQRVKILEGKQNSPDVRLDVLLLGMHEFIEDNFHNVYHPDYGIVDEHINVYITSEPIINNREELLKLLTQQLYICTRLNKTRFSYDGNSLVDDFTGKNISREEMKKTVTKLSTENILNSKDKIDDDFKLNMISEEYIDTMVWILEKKYNIYKAPRKREKILNAVKQYLFPMKCINRLLREFNNYCGGLTIDKNNYKSAGIDIKKSFAVLNDEKDNLNNAFVILKLYRFLYRLQNKNFEQVDYKNFDCESTFMVSDTDEMQKRIDKNKSTMTEKEAENKAYIDTIRNALAHGNVEIKSIVDDEKLIPLFILTDDWENKKTGEKTTLSLVTPAKNLDAFLQLADYEAFDTLDYNLPKTETKETSREK